MDEIAESHKRHALEDCAANSVHLADERTAPSQKDGVPNGPASVVPKGTEEREATAGARPSAAEMSAGASEMRASMPESTDASNVAQDPGGALATVLCRRCGTMNPPHRERCRRCKSYLVANQVARKYPKLASYDVLLTADELLAGVIADNGGVGAMQMLQRSTAAKLRDCQVVLELNKRVIVREGVETPSGRRAHDRYLACLDRFVRLADRLGLKPPDQMVRHDVNLRVVRIERVIVETNKADDVVDLPRRLHD